jgi:hypothetical protein
MNYATASGITVGVVAVGWYISTVYPDATKLFTQYFEETEQKEPETTTEIEIVQTEKLSVQLSQETIVETETVSAVAESPTQGVDQEETIESKLKPNLSTETLSQHSDQQENVSKSGDESSTKGSEAVTGSFIILQSDDCDTHSQKSQESHKSQSPALTMETIKLAVEIVEKAPTPQPSSPKSANYPQIPHVDPDEFSDLTEEERRKLSDVRTTKLERLELERKLKMLQWKRQQEREVAEKEAVLFDKLRKVPEQMKMAK